MADTSYIPIASPVFPTHGQLYTTVPPSPPDFDCSQINAFSGVMFSNYQACYTGATANYGNGMVVTGDLVINGVSLTDTLKIIEDRLMILVPDPAKLAKFEALRKAYDHYKIMEALCDEKDKIDEPGST